MGFIGYLISLIIVGFIIGGVGRLLVPGRNNIGLGRTLGIGLAGAIFGAIIGGLLGLGAFSLILEVGISAGLVYLTSGHNGRRRQLTSGSRR